MTTFDSILVAAEHGSVGREAVRRAAAVAQRHDARLQIVPLPPRGRRLWRGALAAPAAKAPHRVAQGDALRQWAVQIAGHDRVAVLADALHGDGLGWLLRAAGQADLVVIGQGEGGFVDAWLGAGPVHGLARECPRPLLVVRTPADAPYRRVLLPIDFEACEQAAVRAARRIAGDGGLHLFHALDPMTLSLPQRPDRSEAAVREARVRARAAAHAGLRRAVWRADLERSAVHYTVSCGPPLRAAKRQARHIAADLIVYQRSHAERAAVAKAAARGRLASGVDCDVLIVPSPRAARSADPRAGAATMNSWLHGAAS